MEPEHFRFGGGATETLLNPVVAIGHAMEDADWVKAAVLWGLALAMFWAAHRIAGARDREAERG